MWIPHNAGRLPNKRSGHRLFRHLLRAKRQRRQGPRAGRAAVADLHGVTGPRLLCAIGARHARAQGAEPEGGQGVRPQVGPCWANMATYASTSTDSGGRLRPTLADFARPMCRRCRSLGAALAVFAQGSFHHVQISNFGKLWGNDVLRGARGGLSPIGLAVSPAEVGQSKPQASAPSAAAPISGGPSAAAATAGAFRAPSTASAAVPAPRPAVVAGLPATRPHSNTASSVLGRGGRKPLTS